MSSFSAATDGARVVIDVTPTGLDGQPIEPPSIEGWHPGYTGE
ncbi:MAG TPA: hypothetical protein VH475_03360 [Tepidisphaeraceae bacterium]|jgi:hypothetical protein